MEKLDELYMKQLGLQDALGLDTSTTNVAQWYGAMTNAMIEIGEALAEDTRWKKIINNNNKLPHVDRNNVVEEMADVFIYLLNACIFYGISTIELLEAAENKQNKNIVRLLCLKK